jgi:quercetin dioxygenase-like cupin family protein
MVTLQGPIDMHAVENIGETPLHLVMVERKENTLQRSEGADVVDVSGAMYEVVDENDNFRVLNVTLEPGQKDEIHRVPPSVIIALGPAAGTWHEAGQEPRAQVFRPGSAIFQDATDSISLENTGDRNIRLIVFEVLK